MSRRVRLECGTERAARLHHRRREPLDPACEAAWREVLDRRDGLAPCGTPAAYRRHLRRSEPIDTACREAHRAALVPYSARSAA
jgi:hypothetical protein